MVHCTRSLPVQLAGFSIPYEFLADYLSFASGSVTPRRLKTRRQRPPLQGSCWYVPEYPFHFCLLVLPKKAVVNEYADEPVANGLVHQHRRLDAPPLRPGLSTNLVWSFLVSIIFRQYPAAVLFVKPAHKLLLYPFLNLDCSLALPLLYGHRGWFSQDLRR